MPKLTFITELNTVNFYKRIRTNKSSNISHCICVVEFWNQAAKEKKIQYICLACVAAGPRTRLNHLYRRFRASATQANICLDINYAGTVSLFFFVQKHSGFKRTILVPSRERGRMRHRIFRALFYRTCYAIIFEDSSWFWQCFLFFNSAYQSKSNNWDLSDFVDWRYYPPPPSPTKPKKLKSWVDSDIDSPLKIMRGVFKAAKTVWV